MNKKIILAVGIVLIVIIAMAVYLIYPIFNIVEKNEDSPLANEETKEQIGGSTNDYEIKEASTIAEGIFVPSAHEVKGRAVIIESDYKMTLRFEDFETINGPDLRIYLSSGLDIEDSIDLGPIKATKGYVNYEVDKSVDLERYNKVLVWCRAFRVLFSYSEIK